MGSEIIIMAAIGFVAIGGLIGLAFFALRTMKKRKKEAKEMEDITKDNKMKGNNYVYSEK